MVLGFVVLVFVFAGHAGAQISPTIYLFYGQGCPHCVVVDSYFENNGFYQKYSIEKKEIYFDHNNAILFNNILDRLGVSTEGRGVPTVVIGDMVLVGDEPIIQNFVAEANSFLSSQASVVVPEETSSSVVPIDSSQIGETGIGLTVAAVVAASAVDAINPCAFAVLILLVTAILAAGDHKKALRAGLAFSFAIFISYFLMGLGLYQVLVSGGVTVWFYRIVGWLAIIIGLFNLKDYFWYGKGFLMEVPLSWRPKMKSLIRAVVSPWGAFGSGFLVSLFLLPCTSGPYIVILGLLAKKIFLAQTVGYLLLYNLIFILPMILLTLAVYKGFSPSKAEEIRQKRLRVLHLIAGLLMIVMGIAVLTGLV